jgi:hypothetical protein
VTDRVLAGLPVRTHPAASLSKCLFLRDKPIQPHAYADGPAQRLAPLKKHKRIKKTRSPTFFQRATLWLQGLMVLSLPGYIIYILVGGYQYGCALEKGTIRTKAVIIDERNYFGNSPVTQQYSLSYLFQVGNSNYKGNSRKSSVQVGDSIWIEYAPSDPSISQPVRYQSD